MVKLILSKSRSKSIKRSAETSPESDPHKYLFFVYIQWSQENRELKTYMRTKKVKSEIYMACEGLSEIVANPAMKLNNKNINMAILYQLDDDHDISKNFDVTGVVPTRLDHYLNSSYNRRINFTQDQIDQIVNKTAFTPRKV